MCIGKMDVGMQILLIAMKYLFITLIQQLVVTMI
jgi:hypothetical protein